jgi:hypothetical protein
MTSAAGAASRRWFFGPVPDLLFGCGLLYAGLFTLQTLAGPEMRAWLPLSLLPIVTLLFGAPHYGATLLRVYEQRADRRRYALFAVHATLLLAVAYVAGLHSSWVGSLLVTLYLTWSPWHYAGQNYGVALLFLRRRGVPVPPAAKRLLYASFVLSYALVFLAIHGPSGSAPYAPEGYRGTVYAFLSLGIPADLHTPLTLLAELAYLGALAGAGWILLPLADGRALAPAALLVGVQALWFTVPTIAVQWGVFQGVDPLRADQRAYAFMWVAVGHFVQYLWITTFYAAASGDAAQRAAYLLRTLLVGAALWVLPTLIFAPGLLGRPPLDLGLALLTAAVVNLHHFVLDGAIWKLRDGRIARALLRDPGEALAPLEIGPARRWAWPLLAAVGTFCFLLSLGLKLDASLAEGALARGDVARFRRSAELRAFFGRDSPHVRNQLARQAVAAGDLDTALVDVARSLALHPTAGAFLVEATVHERRGRPDLARGAADRARALAPDDPAVQGALRRFGTGEG